MRAVTVGCIWLAVGCGRLRFDPALDAAEVLDTAPDTSHSDAPTGPDQRLMVHVDFEGGDPLRDKALGHLLRCTGNCPEIVAGGPHGGYATFATAPGCIHIADALDLRSPAFTYALWFRPLSAVNQTVLARPYESETGNRNTFELVVDRDADLAKTAVTTYVYHNRHTRSLTLGAWHHAAGSYDGQMMRVYYDGALVLASLVPTLPLPLTENEPLIGCDRDSAVDYAFFRGELDDVRIYSAALNDTEIAELAAP